MIDLGEFYKATSHWTWLHAAVETLAISIACAFYRAQKKREQDTLESSHRHVLTVCAALGAIIGSRLPGTIERYFIPELAVTERTVIGAILGGWLLIELGKLGMGIRKSSGDLFTRPLILGILLGRLGCLAAGLSDPAFGIPTHLPWAVNFGDGVGRHPTQVYEIAFLGLLLWKWRTANTRQFSYPGHLFRSFLAAYLTFRFAIDFLKPLPKVWGPFSTTQVLCLIGGLAHVVQGIRLLRRYDQRMFSVFAQGRSKNSSSG